MSVQYDLGCTEILTVSMIRVGRFLLCKMACSIHTIESDVKHIAPMIIRGSRCM
jgi:hypothetical protein